MERLSATWDIAGHQVPVTQLDKVYWPDEGLTKDDLLAYYREIAPIMLPHLAARPVTLRVYPDGIAGPGYYRRSRPDDAPGWLRSVDYRPERDGKPLDAILIENEASLIWLANAGAIEFHTWSAHVPDLDEPDVALFDLDPGEAASFADVRQAALRLRELLAQLELRGYPKTSGGRGLHVSLPLTPGQTFEEVRQWVKSVAAKLAAANPETIAVPRGGTHRGRVVSVDYAQNSKGRNTAAPYTVRGLPGAPVSTPLSWEEVASGDLEPSDLTMRTVPERVREAGDLFAPVLEDRQRLPPLQSGEDAKTPDD